MKLLAVVRPPSIYHGWSTRKTFWEETFTDEEIFKLDEFSAVNMKHCGHCNVRENNEIKGSDKYVTLKISLKFDSLEEMRITSSESKVKFGRSGKELITSLSRGSGPNFATFSNPVYCYFLCYNFSSR